MINNIKLIFIVMIILLYVLCCILTLSCKSNIEIQYTCGSYSFELVGKIIYFKDDIISINYEKDKTKITTIIKHNKTGKIYKHSGLLACLYVDERYVYFINGIIKDEGGKYILGNDIYKYRDNKMDIKRSILPGKKIINYGIFNDNCYIIVVEKYKPEMRVFSLPRLELWKTINIKGKDIEGAYIGDEGLVYIEDGKKIKVVIR